MVLLTTTSIILDAISVLPPTSNLLHHNPNDTSSPSLPRNLSDPISHKSLIALSQTLQSSNSESTYTNNPPPKSRTYTLNTLLHNVRPYTPPPPTRPPPSQAYLALKAHLLAEQEEREYVQLTRPNNPSGHNEPLFGPTSSSNPEEEEDDISPTLVLNILLSILLCAFAVFYATRYWPRPGPRVLLSLGAAVVVGVAEAGVYAAYLRKVAEARRREAGRRERRVVVGRDVIVARNKGEKEKDGKGDGNSDGEVVVGGEREEIWGRGVNGGFRRRVRERWEKKESRESDE